MADKREPVARITRGGKHIPIISKDAFHIYFKRKELSTNSNKDFACQKELKYIPQLCYNML